MSLLEALYRIKDEARAEYESAGAGCFKETMQSPSASGDNLLAKGDNLKWMKHMAEAGYSGKINLIYIDPPFFSKSKYDTVIKLNSDKVKGLQPIKFNAYNDKWDKGIEEYLRMLCARFYMMRELLADDGCLLVHLDWHISHYIKVILDDIFGEKNFINEIVWNYKSGGTSKKHFAKKHDTILFYSKTGEYYFKPQYEKSYNRELKPYRFKGVKEYKDNIGWYTNVKMKDVWQIDMVGRTSAERTGYATQKPEALIERIIESCCREGGICADFFGGSGTLAAVCHRMGRNWIYCDSGDIAFATALKRLINCGADYVALEQSDNRKEKGSSRVKAKLELLPAAFSDKSVLNVSLISYSVDVKKLSLPPDSEKAVRKIIERDSLSLIDYWSVDFDFDGKVHKPQVIMSSETLNGHECRKIGDSFEKVSIQVADVFGNNVFIAEGVESDKKD